MMEGVQTSHNPVLAGSPGSKRNIHTQPVPKYVFMSIICLLRLS